MTYLAFPVELIEDEMARIFARALTLLQGSSSQSSVVTRHADRITVMAENLIRFLSGRNDINEELVSQNEPGGPVNEGTSTSLAAGGSGAFCNSPPQLDASFNSDSSAEDRVKRRYLSAKRNIVQMKAQGKSEKSIRARYAWIKWQYYQAIKEAVEKEGTNRDKREQIDIDTYKRFRRAQEQNLGVTGQMIQDWAVERAREFGAESYFRASRSWLYGFCSRFRISFRAITKTISESEKRTQTNLRETIIEFYTSYRNYRPHFPPNRIWNIDQTGFNYVPKAKRTLSNTGERNTLIFTSQRTEPKTEFILRWPFYAPR